MEWTEEGRERGRGRAGLKTKQKEKREGNSEGEEDGRGKGEAGEGRTFSTPRLSLFLPFTVLTWVKLLSTVRGPSVYVEAVGALVGGEVVSSAADAINTSVGLTRSCGNVKWVGG